MTPIVGISDGTSVPIMEGIPEGIPLLEGIPLPSNLIVGETDC
jgi:hypothetical protein